MTFVRIGVALMLVLVAVQLGHPQAPDPLVERGRTAFVANGCHGCHMVEKMGTPIGPNLSHVGTKYSRDYLARWLRDPSMQRPSAHMPKLELSEEQIAALTAFLASLR